MQLVRDKTIELRQVHLDDKYYSYFNAIGVDALQLFKYINKSVDDGNKLIGANMRFCKYKEPTTGITLNFD